jgi:hypothetical protein
MYLKSTLNLLPQFQPYHDLQRLIAHIIGVDVHPLVPWAISFFNGSVILSLLFGRLYRSLPGRNGLMKGIAFGGVGWLLMNLLFFPMMGEGVLATGVGLSLAPALFSLAMLMAYSITLGIAYSTLLPANPQSLVANQLHSPANVEHSLCQKNNQHHMTEDTCVNKLDLT